MCALNVFSISLVVGPTCCLLISYVIMSRPTNQIERVFFTGHANCWGGGGAIFQLSNVVGHRSGLMCWVE